MSLCRFSTLTLTALGVANIHKVSSLYDSSFYDASHKISWFTIDVAIRFMSSHYVDILWAISSENTKN